MNANFRNRIRNLLLVALVLPLFVISIKAIASDVNPCNPAPTANPIGREITINCTYGNITYLNMKCCNNVFIQEGCLGWLQTCSEPTPPPQ